MDSPDKKTDPTTGSEHAWRDTAYRALCQMALRYMGRERRDHTLQPTALVHEVFLRIRNTAEMNPGEFLAAAARTMRNILVDHARKRAALKRGGGVRPDQPSEELVQPVGFETIDLLALDAALERLQTLDADLAKVVHLRYFLGLPVDEIAQLMNVSGRTVERSWATARQWLYNELHGETA